MKIQGVPTFFQLLFVVLSGVHRILGRGGRSIKKSIILSSACQLNSQKMSFYLVLVNEIFTEGEGGRPHRLPLVDATARDVPRNFGRGGHRVKKGHFI